MKRLLLFAVVLAMATTVLAAPVVSCGTLASPVSPCQNGDKIFDNFTTTGFGTAAVSVSEVVPNREYIINVDGIFNANFTWMYDVSVDTGVCASCKITDVGYSLSGQTIHPSPTLTTTAGGVTMGATTGGLLVDHISPPTAGPLHVVNEFAANGGVATRLSNTIVQGTPEPLTLGLTGVGLLALGIIARRRVAQ